MTIIESSVTLYIFKVVEQTATQVLKIHQGLFLDNIHHTSSYDLM